MIKKSTPDTPNTGMDSSEWSGWTGLLGVKRLKLNRIYAYVSFRFTFNLRAAHTTEL